MVNISDTYKTLGFYILSGIIIHWCAFFESFISTTSYSTLNCLLTRLSVHSVNFVNNRIIFY